MVPGAGTGVEWLRENRENTLSRFGTSYRQTKAGTLRNTAKESLEDLRKIFDETEAQHASIRSRNFPQRKRLSPAKSFTGKGMNTLIC
jgi:hypothetical protein